MTKNHGTISATINLISIRPHPFFPYFSTKQASAKNALAWMSDFYGRGSTATFPTVTASVYLFVLPSRNRILALPVELEFN